MSSFIPRPFPPPALVDVPPAYIIDQLHFLAPQYWNMPETSDCTIIVPIPYSQSAPMQTSIMITPPFSQQTSLLVGSNQDAAGLRRASEPMIHYRPLISLNLHMDYLSSQSTMLRALFAGASFPELINTTPNFPQTLNIPLDAASGQHDVLADHIPRILPSQATHPTVFLPVPDPASLNLLFHWIYFGSTAYIEECLDQGIVQWEGIARNVEYLGLPTEIKIFLGRWFCGKLQSEQPDTQTPNINGRLVDSSDSGQPSPIMRVASEQGEGEGAEEPPLPRRGRSRAVRSSVTMTSPRNRGA